QRPGRPECALAAAKTGGGPPVCRAAGPAPEQVGRGAVAVPRRRLDRFFGDMPLGLAGGRRPVPAWAPGASAGGRATSPAPAPRPEPSVAFTVETGEGCPRLCWQGTSPLTADDLLGSGPPPTPVRPRDLAREFLGEFLGGGPRTSRELWEAAQQEGLSERTLY